MKATRRRGVSTQILAVLAVLLFLGTAVVGYYTFFAPVPATTATSSTTSTTSSSCAGTAPVTGEKLSPTTFGAVTEYQLGPNRTPGGFAVAPDGSVWFGEWGLPGVAHLYQNGTLTEYKWPYANSNVAICGQQTNIWGVALWNGSVWGADQWNHRLVAVNPSTGKTEVINLTKDVTPYTLSVGDGDLWFTVNAAPGVVGRVSPNSAAVQYLDLPNNTQTESIYTLFKNSTLGYVLTIDLTTFSPKLYSFNPSEANPTFTPAGGNQTLYEPSSLALGEGGIWATEHDASAMAFLNATTNQWTIYPTSTVPYVPVVLTYFDGSNGTAVWFNEHYSNRMGVITGDGRYLTEYSITNPPIFNITTILENYNMVTMGLATDGAWFAAATAGIVGFVNGSYHPPFSISTNSTSVQLAPGGSTTVGVQYTGNVPGSNLSLQFEDNENQTGTPSQISFTPGTVSTSQSGTSSFVLTLSATNTLQPGTYIGGITVTNGSIYRTVYVTIDVS